jgi:iron complex transport system substrate-binding protein
MRIVSLLPSATEIVYELGLEDDLIAVTAECDFPPAARSKPVVSTPAISQLPGPQGSGALSPAAIDAVVREEMAAARPLYNLDTALIQQLRPDLVIAQDLCRVCAVPSGDVTAALEQLGLSCAVLSLDPQDLAGVLSSIGELATAAGAPARGESVVARLSARIDAVRAELAGRPRGPDGGGSGVVRTVALEWADPAFVGGHWVPDMVKTAGGEPLLVQSGERSREVAWEQIRASEPDAVVFMPCGYDLAGAVDQAPRVIAELSDRASKSCAVFAVDATSYFSRPGPRLVAGIEILAAILHPGSMPEPAAGRSLRIR